MRDLSSPSIGVVLGLLVERPSYGYELVQRVNERMGPAWGLTPSSVYPLLDRLEARRLITRGVKDLPGRARYRERVVYAATDCGRLAFERWMQRPVRRSPIRSEVLAKIAVARPTDVRRLLAALDEYERSCIELLEQTSGGERPPRRWDALLFELIDRAADRQLNAEIAWIDDARRLLQEHAPGGE